MSNTSTLSWSERDVKHVWHPFTQMKSYAEENAPVIEEGDGVFLIDTDGTEYYDGVSSIWLNVHGHQNEAIDNAIRDQLDRVAHSTLLGLSNKPAVEFAEQLVEATPKGLNHVFYADSGANAVEIAMKMAIQYFANQAGEPTSHQHFLTFEGGYHGDTFGPMSVVPDDTFHWPFEGMLPEPIQVPFPHPYRWPGTDNPDQVRNECLQQVETKLQEHGDEVAAIMVEPVQGAGGMIVPPNGFLSGLRELSLTYDVLLLVDEVATGFGRTGALFACEKEQVTPDVMMLGKGITGGYLPLSAAVAQDHVYEEFLGEVEEKNALFHGHSYTGNPLACAAGQASLNELQDNVLPEVPQKAERIRSSLQPLEDEPHIGEYRQSGFMCALELVQDENGTPFPYEREAGHVVRRHAENRGMIIRPIGNNVLFLPPLASTNDELTEMTNILSESVRSAKEQLLS